jgi:gliding motility-associated-like protein
MLNRIKYGLMLAFLLVFSQVNFAQLYCLNCPGRDTTSYTNGYENDSLYFLCQGEVASLRVTWSQAELYNVQWFRFSSLTNAWNLVSTQTQVAFGNYTNGTPGGFRVLVTDVSGDVILEDICWISRINSPPVVNANTLQPGCSSVQLSGLYFPGNITGYYNPPPTNFNEPYLFDSNSNIEICFDIIHPILSDLSIELVSPPSCGSETVVLTSTQTPANADSICYNSDAVNLCFSNLSNLNYDLCELGSENVSGVFGSYGLNAQAIDWSPIQGCDVTQPGWEIHVFDCFGGANGFWESASMVISDESNNGLPIYHEFIPDQGQDSTILDNSCDGGLFTVIDLVRPYPQASLLSQGVGIQWATNPPIELPNNGVGLTLLLDPGPTQDVYFSLTLSNIELGDACGAQSYDVEFFDYIQPDSSVITLTDSILCLTDEPLLLTTTISEGNWVGPIEDTEEGAIFDPAALGVGLYSISFEPVSSCIDPTEVFVLVDEAPTLVLPDAQSFCSTDSLVVLEAYPAGGVWTGSGIIDSIAGIFDPSLVLSSGSSALLYTAGLNCPATSSVSFVVETYIPLQILNADTTICNQSLPLDLDANLLTTTWQGSGLTSSTPGIFNPSLAGAGEHVIIATYDQGCRDADTLVVRVDDGMLDIEPLLPICEGADTLDLLVVADSGVWSGIGIIDSLQGMVDVGLLVPGNNQFYYSLRNSCAFTDSVTLFVEEFVPLQILASDTAICIESGTLNLESNLSLVQWQGEGIISDDAGDIDPLQSGVGEFLIVANYNQACSSADSIMVKVDDGTLNIEPLLPICEGSDTLNLQVLADSSGVWSGTGIIDSLQGMVDVGLLVPGNNQFYYTLRNSCAFIDSVTLFVEGFIPLQILGSDTAVCVESGTFNLESNLTQVQWQGEGVISENGGLFSPTSAGVGEFLIEATYDQACSSSDSVWIEVEDATIVLQSLSPICIDAAPFILQAIQGQGNWSGQGLVDNVEGVVDPSQLNAGTYYFTLTLSNSCATSDSVSLTVVDFPVIDLVLPDGICVDQSPIVIEASLNGGQFSGTGIEGSNVQWLFNAQLAGEGAALIQYDYTNVCTSIVVDSIEVYPLPLLTIAADTVICPEGSAQLYASGAAQYSWSPAGSLQSPDLAFTDAQPEDTTLYTVEGISEFGCVASEDIMVNVFTSPIPTTNGPLEICKGESEFLEVTGLVSAQWSGPSLESPDELLTVASPSQTTTYLVGGFDSNGCFGDTTLEVVVYEPIAFFNASDTLGTPPMEVFFENVSNGDYFIWDFGNGDSLVTNDINAPAAAIFDGEQFHTITLTAFLNGCPAVYSYTLETYYDSELLVVPNVVSANGDGKNDTWRVISRNMGEMQVDIFNRWGNLIEQLNGISDYWDPQDVSAGTYYYRLLAVGLDGELYNREGQITVLTSEN